MTQTADVSRPEQLFKDAKIREGVPRLDPKKVWGLFTHNEARRARRLAREDNQAALRAMIVGAMSRSQQPFAYFVKDYKGGKIQTFDGSIEQAVAAAKAQQAGEHVTPGGIVIPKADS